MEKIKKNDSYSHILKYTGVFGGVQGINILVGVVRNKLVAMILGPGGMGLMSLFNSTIKLISDSTNLGIPMSAIREISDAYANNDEKQVSKIVQVVRVWCLFTGLLGMLLCIFLSPLLNEWTFTRGNHTLHFIALSPIVFLSAVTSGEMAILKALRKLKSLALVSLEVVFCNLLLSVPLYLIWKETAVVPSLVLIAAIQVMLAIFYSYHICPPRFHFNKSCLSNGFGMAKLGIAFLMAGVLGSGAEFLIRTYLNNTGDLETVGLYNAGFMIVFTYAGMVFQAMETDYFPRLSACPNVGNEFKEVANRQVEVSLLLVSPLLSFFIVVAPIVLPLLFSSKFLPVLGMVRVAVLAMYIRAIALPIEYISLSKGDSRSFLILECFYNVFIVASVIIGYRFSQLNGAGFAITIASLMSLLVDLAYLYGRYQYALSRPVICYFCVQFTLGVMTYLTSVLLTGLFSVALGCGCAFVSLCFTLKVIRSKTHLYERLKIKFMNILQMKRNCAQYDEKSLTD